MFFIHFTSSASIPRRPPTPNMSALQEEFDLAVEVANKLPGASNEDMLELYGWFKQANVGDVNTGTIRRSSSLVFRRA